MRTSVLAHLDTLPQLFFQVLLTVFSHPNTSGHFDCPLRFSLVDPPPHALGRLIKHSPHSSHSFTRAFTHSPSLTTSPTGILLPNSWGLVSLTIFPACFGFSTGSWHPQILTSPRQAVLSTAYLSFHSLINRSFCHPAKSF